MHSQSSVKKGEKMKYRTKGGQGWVQFPNGSSDVGKKYTRIGPQHAVSLKKEDLTKLKRHLESVKLSYADVIEEVPSTDEEKEAAAGKRKAQKVEMAKAAKADADKGGK